MFNMDSIDKSVYYKKAEEFLNEHNLECFKIDKDRFGFLSRDNLIKVYFLPFCKKTVTNKELLKAKEIENIVFTNDRFSKRKAGEPYQTRENGYLLLKMEESIHT